MRARGEGGPVDSDINLEEKSPYRLSVGTIPIVAAGKDTKIKVASVVLRTNI